MKKRLARGDPGINPLDAACKEHDIAYSKYKDTKSRTEADKILQQEASKRVISRDASLGERATAMAVSAAMGAKRALSKVGGGLSKRNGVKTITFNRLVKDAKTAIKRVKPDNVQAAIKVAVASIKKLKKGKRVKSPRIIKLPPIVSGGVLPLIPIFAGLTALGSFVGSSTGIISAINRAKEAQNTLEERKRHNARMEDIAVGKGYYLKTMKNGKGYYLKVP